MKLRKPSLNVKVPKPHVKKVHETIRTGKGYSAHKRFHF